VQFTSEDFDQVVDGGNFVTKVIYLPDPKYQELAVAGVETLVSTRLEPGIDPILEADKRGTILLIVRLGAIDLESPNVPVAGAPFIGTPAGAPITGAVPAASLPPGTLPSGVAAPVPGNVVLDPAAATATPTPPVPAATVPPVPAPPVPGAPAPR